MSDSTAGGEGFAELEFTDRYGGNYPDPATMCQGQCEGLGCYPVSQSDSSLTEYEMQAIQQEIAAGKQADEIGYYFITCGDCGGTGKRKVD